MTKFLFANTIIALAIIVTSPGCGRANIVESPTTLKAIPTKDDLIANEQVEECIAGHKDVASKLTCIPGLKVEREVFSNLPSGYRRFDLVMEQPLDHFYPNGRKFGQNLVLWHRDESDPMILHTSGYKIFTTQLYLLAQRWQTNQIQVTHRYFDGAEPREANWDWSKLNVAQSAADFHRIIIALKQIYPKNWVNNGASKGGMTSVFTRRFYPNDLSGTVADVAPLSFAAEDPRYLEFVDSVGGKELAECRSRLRELQRSLLTKRNEFLTRMDTGKTFRHLGGKDVAFEHAIVSLPYGFHQYHNVGTDDPIRCETIPKEESTSDDLWNWLIEAGSPLDLNDTELKVFVPYYYQANTELGGSADRTDIISDLLLHPYNSLMYGPKRTPQVHSEDAMRDIELWVKTQSEGIMFVYGGNDPWSAAMFPYRSEADSYRFVVAKGNHRAKFIDLPSEDKQKFVEVLNRWLGKKMPSSFIEETLPIEDPEIRL